MKFALMALVIFVLGWFALGSSANVKRGNRAMKWMQGGLKTIGDKATVRWIGTTAVDLGIANAKPPFESASVVVFLAPRDLPWLWAASRARGRRDTLILRAALKKAPVVDLELLDRESWSGRDAESGMKNDTWVTRDVAGLSAAFKVESALDAAPSLADAARASGAAVRRVSVRRKDPHLTLHVDLPAETADAAAFFSAFRALGEQAGRRPA
jgi:hypothetical protein